MVQTGLEESVTFFTPRPLTSLRHSSSYFLGLLDLKPLAREKIGLLGRNEVGPPGVCLIVDFVTHAALEEASITSIPFPLVLPLPEGFGLSLVSGPVLSSDIKTESLLLGTVPGVLKGLLVILSSSLMKEVMLGVFIFFYSGSSTTLSP